MVILCVLLNRILFMSKLVCPIVVILVAYFIFKHQLNEERDIMVNTGLLVVSNIGKAIKSLSRVCKHVNNTLYISINSNQEFLPIVSENITTLYTKSTSICNDLDVRLLLKPTNAVERINTQRQIEVVLYDDATIRSDPKKFADDHIANLKNDIQLISLDLPEPPSEEGQNIPELKTYQYVALGGTFDRLHNGHKILLTEAVLRCKRHLTVGVTDINMIKSKKLWELIQPVSERIEVLKHFLHDINPELEYDIVPIQDVYGPTKDDPRYELLVVSEETRRGGEVVNAKRAELGLPVMDVHIINLAEDMRMSQEEEEKISSSNRRMRLLGTVIREPKPNPNIPKKPYVIGLSGGVASGKTKITERMVKMGAAVVNCDLIGHDLYKPGMPINGTLAETFGMEIILPTGEINRKRLGEIVFSDKKELEKLNSIMWPAIIQEARQRIEALGREGYSVVVMEAAIMLQAGWQAYCHQLWVVIVPPEEAIDRLMQRNNLSAEEARRRVEAQPSNAEQVAAANVVFSPYWSFEYTQNQLDRAWSELQKYRAGNKL